MEKHPLNDLMDTTMDKIRGLINNDTVVGKPIVVSDKITLIPISKSSFGFASGGSDFGKKDAGDLHFGGGSGAGVTVTPLGFITINDGSVSFVPAEVPAQGGGLDGIVSGLPDLVMKFKTMFGKKKDGESDEAVEPSDETK